MPPFSIEISVNIITVNNLTDGKLPLIIFNHMMNSTFFIIWALQMISYVWNKDKI